MKKILTLLTGLSVTIAPASQIISCEITTNNAYTQPSDIAKFWNTKLFNTISIDSILTSTTVEDSGAVTYAFTTSAFEDELRKLIANNFNNQDYVNERLGIDESGNVTDRNLINFSYYYSKNQSSSIPTLGEYLTTQFQSVNTLKEIEIYFQYYTGSIYTSPATEFYSINVTNAPKMVESAFASGIFESTLQNQTEIYISNYYVNSIKTVIGTGTEAEILSQLTSNKTTTVYFLKGLLQSIQDITKIKLADSLVWEKTTNPSSSSYYWTRLTPEEQLFNLLDTEFVNFINDLINFGNSRKLNSFLGLASYISDQDGINFVVKN